MVLEKSALCQFGWEAPNFNLLGVDNSYYNLNRVKGNKGTLVMFICNHCPYVQAITERLILDIILLQNIGIGIVAIMPNAVEHIPADSYENMKKYSNIHDFTFPYVIDDSQEVAKNYNAICTPDFFGFNSDLKLQYRGRLDEFGKNHAPDISKRELLEAMTEISETGEGPKIQYPSIGCSIKWR